MSVEFQLRLDRPGFALELAATLPGRGITAAFGRSGCGKTTLLRCLAGLEPSATGLIRVAGEAWLDAGTNLPAHRRPVGYVFQDGRLFRHLDVRGNLGYGYRRVPPGQRQLQPDEVSELLGLTALLDRQVAGLSGGQRQRVAIGRALLTSPRLLLLDEPLAALDAISKEEIMPWLERLHRELALPVLLVTHAREEVARLADYLLLIEDGRLLAAGTPAELFARTDLTLAATDDASAVIEARVTGYQPEDRLLELAVGGQRLLLGGTPRPAGESLRVLVRARDVSIALAAPADTSVLNCLEATVIALSGELRPGELVASLTVDGQPLLARLTLRSARQLALAPGMRVKALVKAAALGS